MESLETPLNEIIRRHMRMNREKGHRGNGEKPTFLDLMLRLTMIHTEVSEAAQIVKRRGNRNTGERALGNYKDCVDFNLELADIVLRVIDIADLQGCDLEEAILEKLRINALRPDKYGTSEEKGQTPN